jgi:hypothetical protein
MIPCQFKANRVEYEIQLHVTLLTRNQLVQPDARLPKLGEVAKAHKTSIFPLYSKAKTFSTNSLHN